MSKTYDILKEDWKARDVPGHPDCFAIWCSAHEMVMAPQVFMRENAALIAAAPDLARAVIGLTLELASREATETSTKRIKAAEAALKKAGVEI